MNKRGITKENLLLIVPPALVHDPSIMALAEADAEALAARLAEIDRVRIIPNIDHLDEAVLDILARDFKVDWWNSNFNLIEKHRTLKSSWRVHKTLGTKYALEQAISDIYPQTTVQEWWEYGGEPYCFRIMIGNFDELADPEKLSKIRRAISRVKRLSAHLDGIDISSAVLSVRGCIGGVLPPPVMEDTIPARREEPRLRRDLAVQGGCADIAVTAVGETKRAVWFHKHCYSGGGFALAAVVQLPVWGDYGIYDGPLQLSGGAMSITETEVLHL